MNYRNFIPTWQGGLMKYNIQYCSVICRLIRAKFKILESRYQLTATRIPQFHMPLFHLNLLCNKCLLPCLGSVCVIVESTYQHRHHFIPIRTVITNRIYSRTGQHISRHHDLIAALLTFCMHIIYIPTYGMSLTTKIHITVNIFLKQHLQWLAILYKYI